MCCKLPVPLDRQHLQGRKIKIYEVYLHTDPAGTYTRTVTGTFGSLQYTTSVALQCNKLARLVMTVTPMCESTLVLGCI
jgi:hypothetical protein